MGLPPAAGAVRESRFLAEPALSEKSRSFAEFTLSNAEGLRMTAKVSE